MKYSVLFTTFMHVYIADKYKKIVAITNTRVPIIKFYLCPMWVILQLTWTLDELIVSRCNVIELQLLHVFVGVNVGLKYYVFL